MKLGARHGILFGVLGAATGVLLSGAISIEALSALAAELRGSLSGGPLFAIGGFAAASLGLFLGARRSYANRDQRRRYLSLTIGTLALIVLPASLIRLYGLSPLSNVPAWVAGSFGFLALAAVAFVAALPRLMPPKEPTSRR